MDTVTKRTPRRRGVLTSLLTLLAVGFGYVSLNKTWYFMTISVPNITLPGIERFQTGYAEASAELTAFTLTMQGTAMTYKGPQAALASIAGMPTIMLLLTLGSILIITSAFFQNSLFAVVSVILGIYTRNIVNSMQTVVENPMYGGEYMQQGPGIEQFMFSLYGMISSGVLVALYVALNNHRRRKEGNDSGGSLLDTIYSVHQGALARAASRLDNKNLDNKNSV